MPETLTLLGGIFIGLAIGYYAGKGSGVSIEKYADLCEKHTQDRKGFATAYSELSIQMYNAKNNTDASFTRNIPQEQLNATQKLYDEDDLLAGILSP
mgnify:CR=1 FL=1